MAKRIGKAGKAKRVVKTGKPIINGTISFDFSKYEKYSHCFCVSRETIEKP